MKWARTGRSGGRSGRDGRRQSAPNEDRRAAGSRPPVRRPPVRPSRRSTAPPSSTSAASRRGPIRGTACPCSTPRGERIGEVGHGNRKDIRNAVEAAHKAAGLGADHGAPPRAGALLPRRESRPRGDRERVRAVTGVGDVADEVELAIDAHLHLGRVGGQVRRARSTTRPIRNVTLAMPEPIGVIGVVCPDAPPLLGLRLDGAPGDRDGQHGDRDPVRRARRSPRPISIRCWTHRTCRAA